jgi:hypothetical protein
MATRNELIVGKHLRLYNKPQIHLNSNGTYSYSADVGIIAETTDTVLIVRIPFRFDIGIGTSQTTELQIPLTGIGGLEVLD